VVDALFCFSICRYGREDLVEVLIKAGSDVLIKNKKNKTAADLVEEYSRNDPNPNFAKIKKMLQDVMGTVIDL
jgi:hypothetical protein